MEVSNRCSPSKMLIFLNENHHFHTISGPSSRSTFLSYILVLTIYLANILVKSISFLFLFCTSAQLIHFLWLVVHVSKVQWYILLFEYEGDFLWLNIPIRVGFNRNKFWVYKLVFFGLYSFSNWYILVYIYRPCGVFKILDGPAIS